MVGSWVVHDAVSAGYRVRAVVRDKSRPDKVDHILAINNMGFSGSVELHEADLADLGSSMLRSPAARASATAAP
jgi:uncharacterized protein YbjT (DUF2867 family)